MFQETFKTFEEELTYEPDGFFLEVSTPDEVVIEKEKQTERKKERH